MCKVAIFSFVAFVFPPVCAYLGFSEIRLWSQFCCVVSIRARFSLSAVSSCEVWAYLRFVKCFLLWGGHLLLSHNLWLAILAISHRWLSHLSWLRLNHLIVVWIPCSLLGIRLRFLHDFYFLWFILRYSFRILSYLINRFCWLRLTLSLRIIILLLLVLRILIWIISIRYTLILWNLLVVLVWLILNLICLHFIGFLIILFF